MNYDLSDLRKFSRGNYAFELDMIETFLLEADEYTLLIQEGFERNDLIKVGSIAHKFKSSVVIFGMMELHGILDDMEVACKTGNLEILKVQLLPQFEQGIASLTLGMKQEKNNYEKPLINPIP